MKRLVSLLTVALAASAFLTSSAAAQRRNRNVISREEIVQSRAQNVYNLIESIRPMWRSRMSTVSNRGMSLDVLVYVDRAPLRGLNELKQLSVANVQNVEYLDPGKTRFRFGTATSSGAVVVNTIQAPAPAPRDTTGLNVPPEN